MTCPGRQQGSPRGGGYKPTSPGKCIVTTAPWYQARERGQDRVQGGQEQPPAARRDRSRLGRGAQRSHRSAQGGGKEGAAPGGAQRELLGGGRVAAEPGRGPSPRLRRFLPSGPGRCRVAAGEKRRFKRCSHYSGATVRELPCWGLICRISRQ